MSNLVVRKEEARL